MVRKEDLCDWFSTLQPPKRLDYMCGLLHMCLPLELRFVGTVLEDLAKKDFHYLRDKEIRANNPQDLACNENFRLSNPNLRGKILIGLALMQSSNVQCAEIIYSILKNSPENNSFDCLPNRKASEEIDLIFTLAVHHPAFKIHQKLHIGGIHRDIQARIQELHGHGVSEERDLPLPSQSRHQNHVPVYHNHSQMSPIPSRPDKVLLKSIEVKGLKEEPQQRKGGHEFQLHTLWSNGEINEVFYQFKHLQELHHKMLQKFPEQRKQHTSIPVFPGRQSFYKETDKEKINSLNTYFRELSKAPSHILNCDVLYDEMRCGKIIRQVQVPPQPPCVLVPRSFYEDNNGPVWLPQYTMPQFARIPFCPNAQMTSPSQVSSSTESPANSRTSSPALTPHHTGVPNRNNQTSPGTRPKGLNAHPPGFGDPELGSNVELSLSQLLRLLNLDKYLDNLRSFSLKQIISMSKEELSKAGLPVDAQEKLRSKLDQLKQKEPDNGLVDVISAPSSADVSPPMVFQLHHVPFPQYGHTFIQHPFVPSQQPSPVALLASPNSQMTGGDSSPANSDVSSPPASPSLNLATVTTDSLQGPPRNQMVTTQSHSGSTAAPLTMMTPPVAVAVASISPSNVKVPKNSKSRDTPPDSSSSEDDRVPGLEQGNTSVLKNHGPGKPELSLPPPELSSINNGPTVTDDNKEIVMPIPVSSPPSTPTSVSVDSNNEHVPLPNIAIPVVCASSQISISAPAAVMNGYLSDPPPVLPPGAVLHRPVLNHPFKNAQPTHTAPGMHKTITMPGFDHTSQIPQGKGSGMILSGLHSIPHHSLMAPPVGTTSNQGMVQGNHQATNNNALPPPSHLPGLTSDVAPAGNFQAYPPIILRPPNLQSMPPPRNILTTVASSTSVMTTTQSHSAGPPPSHSPSPVSTVTSNDQVIAYLQGADLQEQRSLDRNNTGTPPSQAPLLLNKPNVTGNSSGANTPSPPLIQPLSNSVPPNSKQHPANCLNCESTVSSGSGAHPMYFHTIAPFLYPAMMAAHNPNNGLVTPMPPFFQPQASYPNGINPELYMAAAARIPAQLAQGQVPPFLYGNSYPAQNQGMPHNMQTTAPPPATVNMGYGHHNNVGTTKIACYNCGNIGHKAAECKDSSMENMSKTYRLNFRPKSDSE